MPTNKFLAHLGPLGIEGSRPLLAASLVSVPFLLAAADTTLQKPRNNT